MEINSVDPIKFIEIWKKVCSYNKKSLLERWNDARTFTSKILYDSDSIVKSIAFELDLCVYSECRAGYYGIDAVFYYSDFRVTDTGTETWLTKIQIALEHENYFGSNLFTEISRLLTSSSELRVLITYPKNLNDYQRILNDFRYLFSNLELSVLVILGFNKDDDITWKCYYLNKHGLEEIVKF